MPELKAFYQPRSLSEAIALLEEHGDRARPLAGGTALTQSRTSRVEVLIDLGHLDLDRIEDREDGLHLGAMVTCSSLIRHLRGDQAWALLGEAAASVGSRVLQNQVTVGGNCVMVYAWSDLPVALWCAEARFLLQGRSRRELTADAFFAEHPSRLLGTGELLVEVVVPRLAPSTGAAYLKLGRNSTDHGLASAAVQVSLREGRVSAARIVAGAVRGLPQLVPVNALIGQEPDPDRLQEAARQAVAEIKIVADFRAGAEYRRQLLFSLIADALGIAAERARGGAA